MVSPAQRAISLLIDMAEQGEIDPWNVRVIDVIDRFLAELQLDDLSGYFTRTQGSFGQNRYEADLSESGQAFLYASMLVLLKADTLVQEEEQPETEDMTDTIDLAEESGELMRLPSHLENQLRRRAVARPPQQRRVTLAELIEQLEVMAAAMELPIVPRPKARPRPQSRGQAIRAISQLAHQENLSEMADSLGEFIERRWPQLPLHPDGWFDFDELVRVWHRSPNNTFSKNIDRVGVFWALLFLSAQGKVELVQREFYKSLELRRSTLESSPALVDAMVASAS
ncbi:MAG: segregation/condensation protein A [Synechococcales cyanobacterium CRU_2_2]|nr:segregation/condensation protein A [Synechococcales cyanobacterium CRU_2_2]